MVALANEEQRFMIAQVGDHKRLLTATQLEIQTDMDGLKLKAAVLEKNNVATAASLLGAQEQVKTAMAEAKVTHVLLTADLVMNATPILDETEMTWTSKVIVKKYSTNKCFHHVNAFCKGRENRLQRAKYMLNVAH
jgi:hypothetical protein